VSAVSSQALGFMTGAVLVFLVVLVWKKWGKP